MPPPVSTKEDIRTQRKSLANLFLDNNPREVDRRSRRETGKQVEIRPVAQPEQSEPPEKRESKAHLEFLEEREKWRKSKGGEREQ